MHRKEMEWLLMSPLEGGRGVMTGSQRKCDGGGGSQAGTWVFPARTPVPGPGAAEADSPASPSPPPTPSPHRLPVIKAPLLSLGSELSSAAVLWEHLFEALKVMLEHWLLPLSGSPSCCPDPGLPFWMPGRPGARSEGFESGS